MSLLPDFASFYNVPAPDYRRARFYREETFKVYPYSTAGTAKWRFTRLDWPALMLRQHDVFDVRVRVRVAPWVPAEGREKLPAIIVAALSSPNLGILSSETDYSGLVATMTYGALKGEQRDSALSAVFDGYINAWELDGGTGIGGSANGIVLTATSRFEGCTKASAWPSLYVLLPSFAAGGYSIETPPMTMTIDWSVVSTRSTWAENAAAENEGDWDSGNLIQSTMDELGWLCDLGADPAKGQYRPEQQDALTGAASLTDLSRFWSVYDSTSDF